MSFFVESTPAPHPKTKNIRPVSLLLAGILVAMIVAQLFTFEDFSDVIAKMGLPGGEAFAGIRAALIVTLEVAALPFLLSMRLSPAARLVSMGAGWGVIVAWLFASVWINVTHPSIANSGLLGATVSVAPGRWVTLLLLGFAVLAAWIAWGMWPLGQKRKRK